jgi:CheY-like chemotaxis protein
MKTILVIDSEQGDAEASTRILRYAGYLLHAARSAREALERAVADRPELILAIGGPGLYEALRSLPALRSTPILALLPRSGGPEDSIAIASTGHVDGIVPIPANPVELLTKVRYLLRDEVRRPPPRAVLRRGARIEAGDVQATGSLVNLSGSGAFVETDIAGALEGPVRLRFSLPGMNQVFAPVGRVVRTIDRPGRPAGVALEFIDLDERSRRDLEEFLFLRG